ncbi:uncharacterized protein LOC123514679 isoform X2 [Portunus trituberculatus]|uniref:uncharacterized protein LOC123514679 isoform X2 n=1 Tax=Portunus trituberculatus TaxID=210409 RepID=UPI001E1CD3B7|nr:uncharacterized protein LOC123514679 isoform X2 [Portunus trituberculatus]
MLPSVCIKMRLSRPRTAFVSRFLSVVIIFIFTFYCGRLVFLQLTSSIFTVHNIREPSQEMKLGGEEEKPQNLNMRTRFLRPHRILPEEFPYKYLINEPHLCHGRVFIINMIPSALYNSESRQRISLH